MPKRRRLNIVSINNHTSGQEADRNEEHEPARQHEGHSGTAEAVAHSTNIETSQPSRSREAEASQPASVSADELFSQAGIVKKGRGPTKKLAIWELKSNTKVAVTFNEMVQPIGAEGRELTQFLGTLVKMPRHIGINFSDWRDIGDNTKETLWDIVKEKFIFLPAETTAVKKWVLGNMSSKWRSWKNMIKSRIYDLALSIDEMVENEKDERVNKSQLKELVTMWIKPESQAMSEDKKASRSKNQEPHVTGSKSFARLTEEEAAKNNGIRPTRGQIFIRSRTTMKQNMSPDQFATMVDTLNTEVRNEQSPTNHRSSAGSHQPG